MDFQDPFTTQNQKTRRTKRPDQSHHCHTRCAKVLNHRVAFEKHVPLQMAIRTQRIIHRAELELVSLGGCCLNAIPTIKVHFIAIPPSQ